MRDCLYFLSHTYRKALLISFASYVFKVFQIQFDCIVTVSSGTLTVNDDASVQILAEEAVPLEHLDIAVS